MEEVFQIVIQEPGVKVQTSRRIATEVSDSLRNSCASTLIADVIYAEDFVHAALLVFFCQLQPERPFWYICPLDLGKRNLSDNLGQRRSPLLATNPIDVALFAHVRVKGVGWKLVANDLSSLIDAQAINAGIGHTVRLGNTIPVIDHSLQRMRKTGIIGVERQKKSTARLPHSQVMRNVFAGMILLEISNWKISGVGPACD